MKTRRLVIILCIISILCSGCRVADDGTTEAIGKSYTSAISHMDNKYFKAKVLTYDKEGGYIIQNEITGEYFVVVSGSCGISVCPIKVLEDEE